MALAACRPEDFRVAGIYGHKKASARVFEKAGYKRVPELDGEEESVFGKMSSGSMFTEHIDSATGLRPRTVRDLVVPRIINT